MIEHFARPSKNGITFAAVVKFRGRVVHVDDEIPNLLVAATAAAEEAANPRGWNLAHPAEIEAACFLVRS